MKFNKQKIEEIKNIITNVKGKITSNKKEKVPKKYYALLLLMLLIGMITLTNNVKQYKKSITESFNEYRIEDTNVDSDNVDLDMVEIASYITDESSISTETSNMEDKALEAISNNTKLYIMPIVGEVLKEFAQEKLVYSETLGMWKTHPGIDIKANLGDKVKSASDGEVVEVIDSSFYGNTVKIKDSQGYIFVYSNLDNDITLKKGNMVKQGDIIGLVGVSAAGELLEQTHLHFEVIKSENQVNPQDLIN